MKLFDTYTSLRSFVPFPVRQRFKRLFLFGESPQGSDLLTPLERRKKFIFIHIPKTGGTSISSVLFGKQVYHRPLSVLEEFDYWAAQRFTILAVLRDPIERFLSSVNYLLAGGTTTFDREFLRTYLAKYVGRIDAFVSAYITSRSEDGGNTADMHVHFRTQSWFLKKNDGTIPLGIYIPYESLQDRFNKACLTLNLDQVNIPRLNVTQKTDVIASKLSEESIRAIRHFYRHDYELLDLARDEGVRPLK